MTDARNTYLHWKQWSSQGFGSFTAAEATYFAWHVARALPKAQPGLCILELGFGNGNFAGWARAQGHTVFGLEAQPELVARAQAHGMVAASQLSELPGGDDFDLIVAFDVIEHVSYSELPGLLASLNERLRAGGRLMLRFPNGESPFGLAYQYGDFTHLTVLGLARVRQLALGCGLVVEHHGDTLPWRLTAQGHPMRAWWRHMWRKRFERRLRKCYGFGHFDFSPNQLVVLRAVGALEGEAHS